MSRTTGIVLGLLLAASVAAAPVARGQVPRIGDPTPGIDGKPWINSHPVTLADLHGKVVLIYFWTYG